MDVPCNIKLWGPGIMSTNQTTKDMSVNSGEWDRSGITPVMSISPSCRNTMQCKKWNAKHKISNIRQVFSLELGLQAGDWWWHISIQALLPHTMPWKPAKPRPPTCSCMSRSKGKRNESKPLEQAGWKLTFVLANSHTDFDRLIDCA